jgi:two-component system, OmpR family, phosphate regulon response regulator OmpR
MNKPLALVIEDDHDLATIFTQALRAAGYDVDTIGTQAEAFTRLANCTPQVVTLDLHLQQSKGDEILRSIRAEPRLAQASVILTTADAALADELQDQADFVLIKPISFAQLRDLTARLKPKP